MKSSAGVRIALNAYNETRKFLGYDTEVAPVPRTELVDQLVAEGYDSSVARDYISLSIKRNVLVRVDETVLAHRDGELVEVKEGLRPACEDTEADENLGQETDSSEFEEANPQVSATEDNTAGEWHDVDFTDPEPNVWAREWLSRRFWMGRQGKMPYAPWASRDHPEADEDGNARYKWSIADNWATKEKVDEWVEKDTRTDGYVVLLEKETEPYTDDPDPYAFVDGDDVRCPETGEVHPEFLDLLDSLGMTYADISTSGSGVHALYEGALPEDVKQAVFEIDTEPWGENDEPPTVEIYDGKHVCVVTGDHVVGTPENVREWDKDELDDILDEHLDEADRVTQTEGTDTDTENPLDGYEPGATDATETTDELNDVFYAVENLSPRDLPLRTKRVGEDATGWEKWDPSTYRQSSGNDSLHSPPGESVFYDQKAGRSFGLLSLYAVEEGILTKPWETLDGSNWWDAVEAAQDNGAPIPEYEPENKGLDPEAVLPHTPKARLITNGWDWTRDGSRGEELRDRIRERTTEKIRAAYEHADRILLDALPTSGKSYGAVKACLESDGDVTILTERRDLYDQIKEWCQELGLRSYTLPAFHRDCPTADGTHGDEWKEEVRDLRRRGATPKEIHAELETPCQDEGACPYSRRWDFDADDYDILIGNYRHAHVDSVVSGRAVVFDEDTSGAFETVLSGAPFKSAVTQYLRDDDAIPFDDFTELLENRDEEIPRDATLEAVGEPEWRPGDVFDGTTTHAGAELAVYALLKGEDLGNGLERTKLPDDAVAVFNRETTTFGILRPPSLEYARSVVALDGTPTPEMWRARLGERLNHVQVLTDDERREYVETALNHRVIPTTPHVKPYSSDRNVTVEKDEALLREIRRTQDREPSLITTKKARDKYDETGVLDLVDGVKHHGDMKGSNDFEEERLGVIIGSRHFGDDFVKKWGAYLGDAVETPDRSDEENRGVGLSYGETGDKILRHMREHETLQGLMRFGRDGRGAVIYCHTNTIPSWYPTETETPEEDAVVRPRSEAERDVIRELRRRGKGRTAELSEDIDVTERRVLQILNRLKTRGVVDTMVEGRGFVWHDDGLHRVNEAGDVALDAVELDELPDEQVHEISRNSTYTASFVKTDGSRASKAGDVAPDASRTPQHAGSGGEPPPD